MGEQLRDILFGSDFFAWAERTQSAAVLNKETTLIEEGSEGKELLILVEGSANVTSEQSDGEAIEIAALDAPALFGEMSFLQGRATVASVKGSAGSRWLRIPFENLRKAIGSDPELIASGKSFLIHILQLLHLVVTTRAIGDRCPEGSGLWSGLEAHPQPAYSRDHVNT